MYSLLAHLDLQTNERHEEMVMIRIKQILAIALAAAMLFMGLQKTESENIIFQTIADKTVLAP